MRFCPQIAAELLFALAFTVEAAGLSIEVQRRDPTGAVIRETIGLEPARTAVVMIDMWDRHWCKTYTARVANLVPRMNETLAAARALGLQVVHAPSDVVDFYRDHPRRLAMQRIPTHPEPRLVDFQPPPEPEGKDCCECGPDRPCPNRRAWSRQQADLVIGDTDWIADCNNAAELFNLCQERGLDTLIYLGVASNMCVCHRASGMLNARRHGYRVLFVRDLVEAITANGFDPERQTVDPNFTPAKGSARTQRYLEQHLAPSLASRQLLAAAGRGPAAADRRPHLVFVIADDEYRSEQTLPEFARARLEPAFRCTFLTARGNQGPDRHDVPGLSALYDADLLVLAMRRRALPVTQMDHLERAIRGGIPLIALRVSVVAFQVEAQDRPDGHVVWRDFDREVLGCRYSGYDPEARRTGADLWVVPDAAGHPVLRGVEPTRWHSPMWIYRQRPLAPGTTLLVEGRWSATVPVEPVAWTTTYEGGRVFYTSLGHWEDFQNLAFQRMLENAVFWALRLRGDATAAPR